MGGSFISLPSALIFLLLIHPACSALSSTNDQFRAISTHAPKEEHPICCLRRLDPVELVQEDILVSFEEWKKKLKDKEEQGWNSNASSPPGGHHNSGNGSNDGNRSDPSLQRTENAGNESTSDPTAQDPMDDVPSEKRSPHFQVPLTDRFNYASMDCSARVHTSHRTAKSPSNILSSKRDRYLLSPCVRPEETQFVVVELCDDIRIDTVQLANFEFFSGVFKDFTVSVAKTYIGKGPSKEGWVSAGTYTAKNVRGVQSFHPPYSLRDFYRFIRIDFHSHYSNEYYCPISLLRVYGLTQLEEWKWDTWEAESRAKLEAMFVEVTPEEPQPAETPSEASDNSSIPATEPASETVVIQTETQTTSSNTAAITSSPSSVSQITEVAPQSSPSTSNVSASSVTPAPPTSESISNGHDQQRNDNEASHTATGTTTNASAGDTRDASVSSSSPGSKNPTTTITATVYSTGFNSVATPAMLLATSGESIYKTIMNRLAAIETNQTLYAQYFEEQTCGVRDMLRKIGEDVGRLEGIEKAQAKAFERNAREWEKQKRRLEMQYLEMVSKVDYLSDEIVLEKRLGIAQLCLLLAVLIFMGLTRGSRGENPNIHGPVRFSRSSVREWGRRHLSLSFSGDWVSRFTSSRSRSHERTKAKSPRIPSQPLQSPEVPPSQSKSPRIISYKIENATPSLIQFPSAASSQPSSAPPGIIDTPTKRGIYFDNHRPHTPRTTFIQRPRSRTPSLRNARNIKTNGNTPLPTTPTTASRPKLKRANSHGSSTALTPSASWGGVGPVPPSAKRWARTAHLHEVKVPRETGKGKENKNEKDNVRIPFKIRNFGESEDPFNNPPRCCTSATTDTDSDGDVWEDTDNDAPASVDEDPSML